MKIYADELKDYAAAKYGEGMQFGQIALDMTYKFAKEFNKNMIAGILRRKGVLGARRPDRTGPRSLYVKRGRVRKPRLEKIIRIKIRDLTPRPAPVAVFQGDEIHISLMELTSKSCRWPYGVWETGFTFCGHQKVDKSSYCAGHTKIARK